MKWNFRNLLAIFMQSAILLFWSLQGIGLLQNVPGEINGALISAFTLITQFYFRKKPSAEAPENSQEK